MKQVFSAEREYLFLFCVAFLGKITPVDFSIAAYNRVSEKSKESKESGCGYV